MIGLYLLDVPELESVIAVARTSNRVTVRTIGRRVRIQSAAPIEIDRRATHVRHAVWYSAVSALAGGVVVQFDKDALRIEPT